MSFKFVIVVVLYVWTLRNKASGQNINYFGVAFQPYTKYGNPPPLYGSYLIEEVKTMLRVISNNNRHNAVTTYSSGAADYNLNGPCNYGNCIVARAAAEINRERNSVSISMSQGIYQHDNNNIMTAEINRAFTEANEANQIRPGTIWGLVFTNEYINQHAQGSRVLGMLRQNKQRAKAARLSIGVRIHRCHEFFQNGPLKGILSEIVRESDFIMCNIYPSPGIRNNVAGGVQQVINTYNQAARVVRSIKPIEVMIGETGWASQGPTFFAEAQYNTVRNMQTFWEGIRSWATNSKVKVHMFEAIDEPNKDVQMGEGERHFGWWYRARDNSNTYIEKTTGKKQSYSCKNKH